MHRKPSRIRRFCKWCGLGVCAVIVVVWGVSSGRCFQSGPIPLHWNSVTSRDVWIRDPEVRLGLHDGCVSILYFGADSRLGDSRSIFIDPPGEQDWLSLPTWHWGSCAFAFVPLWWLLVVVGVPTGVLWRRDRRPRPGHCRCGYDLTGNKSGQCPECGRAADRQRWASLSGWYRERKSKGLSRRLRRVKEAGLVVCLLIISLWTVSFWVLAVYRPPGHKWTLTVESSGLRAVSHANKGCDAGWDCVDQRARDEAFRMSPTTAGRCAATVLPATRVRLPIPVQGRRPDDARRRRTPTHGRPMTTVGHRPPRAASPHNTRCGMAMAPTETG